MVGTARRRTRLHRAGALPGRTATQPARRTDKGRGRSRGRAGWLRHALQGAHRVRRRRPLSARILRRVARRRAIRGRIHRGSPAVRISTASTRNGTSTTTVVLAAADPANPYGAALPWPTRRTAGDDEADVAHRPGRKAGALVALVDGQLAWFLERGGRSLLSFHRRCGCPPRRRRSAGRPGRHGSGSVRAGREDQRRAGAGAGRGRRPGRRAGRPDRRRIRPHPAWAAAAMI